MSSSRQLFQLFFSCPCPEPVWVKALHIIAAAFGTEGDRRGEIAEPQQQV
jgi:hypothetical protein